MSIASSALRWAPTDYVSKPFHPRELLARIHAVLRRQPAADVPGAPATEAGEVALGELRLNLATRGP